MRPQMPARLRLVESIDALRKGEKLHSGSIGAKDEMRFGGKLLRQLDADPQITLMMWRLCSVNPRGVLVRHRRIGRRQHRLPAAAQEHNSSVGMLCACGSDEDQRKSS